MLLAEIVEVSSRVAATRARTVKIELLAETLRRLAPEEAQIGVSYLTGSPVQRTLGVGHATVHGLSAAPARTPTLELRGVDEVLERVANTSGAGSKAAREGLLHQLFSLATSEEQEFLRGLILRNLRQGALEGIMADAVARALEVPADRVRRAAMVEGDLVAVSARALAQGAATLGGSTLSIFTPVQPMLAKTAESAAAAIEVLGEAVVERKLDGLRLQVHREDGEVMVFTRNLRNITAEMPTVVRAALGLPARRFILDGEGLTMGGDGTPMTFQDSMSRSETWPLDPFFFDILHLNGDDLVDQPLRERRRALEAVVPETSRVGSVITGDPEAAERFFVETVAQGFEGVVVKDLDQGYEAGRRGSGWLKVKPVHTLDLVVLAAEWGSGRRQGWLSNLHLGARDPSGGFVMLGKTFKGLSDEMLEWQTRRFLELEERREGHVVRLRPEVVYEIAFDGVQRSTRYPGGVALRFARVRRHRPDKTPDDADTIETVRRLAAKTLL